MASKPIPAEHDATAHEHPTDLTYIKVAVVLAIITVIEVAIYYIEALSTVLVPVLVLLSAIKFVTVVGYFMHLKFDTKMLAWIFGAAMIISVAVFVGTWLIMDFDAVEQFIGDMSV